MILIYYKYLLVIQKSLWRPLWYPLIVLNELICSLKFNPEPFIARHPKCTYICVGEYSNRTIWHVNMPAALWCFKESDILTKSEYIFIILLFKQTQQKSIQHFLKFLYVFSVRYLSWPKLKKLLARRPLPLSTLKVYGALKLIYYCSKIFLVFVLYKN